MVVLKLACLVCRVFLVRRSRLLLEILALRQQLAVLGRQTKRPRLKNRDRLFWVFLSRVFKRWKSCLLFVQPETVIGWHRRGFRAYWRWKSRSRKPGRPSIAWDLIKLVRRLARENPLWGAPRVHSEVELLGYEVAQSTVSRYMMFVRYPNPSQTWTTFLRNHMNVTVACDFFVVPTATFRVLYCFVVLSHCRRYVVHFNVTSNPTQECTARQMIEAFPGDVWIPKYVIRDNDKIYGWYFRDRVDGIGIEEVPISPQSPWQNPFVERLVGSARRECTNHVISSGERHLRRVLREYFDYYNKTRPHLSLSKNSPVPRTRSAKSAKVVSSPVLGGLHHEYRVAA